MTDADIKALAQRELERRRQEDPLSYYKPTETQARFHASDAHYRLLSSVNRGGKSACATAELAWLLRGRHPMRKPYASPLLILQFVTSRRQAKYVIGKKLLEDSELAMPAGCPALSKGMLPKEEIAKIGYQKVEGEDIPYTIEMKNGNVLIFSWSGVEDAFKRIAGLKLDGVFIDEDSGTPKLFNEIYPRLLDAQSDPARPWGGFIVWSATNTSYNQAYSDFCEKCENGTWGHARFVIQPNENPAISEEVRNRMVGAMDEQAAAVRLRGTEDAGTQVSIYGKWFRDDFHVSKTDEWPRADDCIFCSYDPGVDHETGIILGKCSRAFPNRITIFWSWIGRGGNVRSDAEMLMSVLKGRRMAKLIYDYALTNRNRGGGPTPLQLFQQACTDNRVDIICWERSIKRHDTGIAEVRQYLRPGHSPTANGTPHVREGLEGDDVPPLLTFAAPSAANGIGKVRAQILAYRGNEATKFRGAGGVVKKDDEACFAADTLILMADLSERRIADVAAGDMVMTPMGPRRVLASGMTAFDAEVRLYVFEDEAGDARHVICTPGHRFMTADGWLKQDPRGGEWLPIQGIAERGRTPVASIDGGRCVMLLDASARNRPVYDLQVEEAGCFYANGLLAHNCDTLRYLVCSHPFWNPAWVCGHETGAAIPRPLPRATEPGIPEPAPQAAQPKRLRGRDRMRGMAGALWIPRAF